MGFWRKIKETLFPSSENKGAEALSANENRGKRRKGGGHKRGSGKFERRGRLSKPVVAEIRGVDEIKALEFMAEEGDREAQLRLAIYYRDEKKDIDKSLYWHMTAAEGGSMKNAMIMAPNTMKGERKKRRRTILIPACN